MSHTKEPWSVDAKANLRVKDSADRTVCSCGTSDSIRDQWEANARRIVACVNACGSEETAFLEFIVSEGKSLRKIHDETLAQKETYQRELCDVERQRNELLAVVNKLVKWNKDYPSSRVYGYGDIKQIAAEMDAINAEARAVIAKVQP